MLEPQSRTLLAEALRPPPGYALDCAVGTTYTLDLLALVAVPLAFTFFDWQDDESPAANPLGLLEAVRRNADRIAIFCQEDRIAVPRQYRSLLAYIESSVVPVRPPEEGSFHPKVWAVRFVAPDQPVRYRLLVLSRNLTFDRSWDTVLALEGELADRKNAYAANHPLGDFFSSLAEMAAVPLADRVAGQVNLVQGELRRVRFELPEGFEGFVFRPLGIRGYRSWPFEGRRVDRMLVISRFLTEGCLRRLALPGRENILVSDVDTLGTLNEDALAGYSQVLVFQEGVEPEPEEEAGPPEAEVGSEEAVAREPTLAGLHAKVYVADAGWKAHVWTGSANATSAAFERNVEFMVELSGRKSRCGVDAVLGDGERSGLLALLRRYQPEEPPPDDLVAADLEGKLETARREVARAGLVASVSETGRPDEYFLSLRLPAGDAPRLPEGVRASCRPITLQESRDLGAGDGSRKEEVLARFGPVGLGGLTSFFAFELTASTEGRELSTGFVLNLPLEGEPEDRRERLLLSMLSDPDQVRRYLILLLAEATSTPGEVLDVLRTLTGSGGDGGAAPLGLPLFEIMVKALHRNPESLDRVARLIDDLRKTTEGRELLPEGLESVWEPIWATRKGLASAATT